MNIQNKTLKLVIAALFAALTTVATMLIQFPTLKGYIHFGDCFVILSGIILGPVYGAAAGGIGSMFADIFSGYMAFAPATLIIKALGAGACGLLFQQLSKTNVNRIVKTVCSGLSTAIIIVLGYFVFEIFYEGFPAAVAEILPNIIQVASGVIFSSILYPVLTTVPTLRELEVK